jgi:DNA-binding XRE family transcriptional regulator
VQHQNVVIKGILAKNLKKYRARLKLTQEEAAENADIATKYWQRLEMVSQIDLPSLPILFRMARVLRVKASDLLRE